MLPLVVYLLMTSSMSDASDTCSARATDDSCHDTPGASCGRVDTITSDWMLQEVEYQDSQVATKKHTLSSMVVTGPGGGTFSASGSKGQRAALVAQSGPKITSDKIISMAKPEITDNGQVAISVKKYDFSAQGVLVDGLPNIEYMGSWYCQAKAGETKQCYAYINEYHVRTKYTLHWQNPRSGCSVKSSGEIVQELWSDPIVVL